ncbi:unnamed protein product, partial [marine sediment metagenome]
SGNRYALGQAYMNDGRYSDADREFNTVMRMDPDQPNGNYGLGLNFSKQGRYEDAVLQFKEAIRIDPKFYDGYAELGYAHADLGEMDEAQRIVDNLEHVAPDLADTLSRYMYKVDLAQAIAPDCDIEIIGIRPGEKLHEVLITEEDGRSTVDYDGLYVILPQFSWWQRQNYKDANELPKGFSYTSNNNDTWLTVNQLKNMAQEFSFPLERPGAPRSFQAPANLAKPKIHKAKPTVIATIKKADSGNNIAT